MAEALGEFDETEGNAVCRTINLALEVFDENTFHQELEVIGFRLEELNTFEAMNYVQLKMPTMDTIVRTYLGVVRYKHRQNNDGFKFDCTTTINIVKNASDGGYYLMLDKYEFQIIKPPFLENQIIVHTNNAIGNGDVNIDPLMPHMISTLKDRIDQKLDNFWEVLFSCYSDTQSSKTAEGTKSEEYPPVRLVLSSNKRLTGLSVQVITDLQFLTVLDISNNDLDHVPVEFGSLLSLRELNISNNKLGTSRRTVAEQWEWLFGPKIVKALQVLDLSNNYLTELPASLWKLRNLSRLNLNNNRLMTLPRKISATYSLECVILKNNRLFYLPHNLLRCPLKYLDVSNNPDLYRYKASIHSNQTDFTDNFESDSNPPSLYDLADRTIGFHNVDYSALPKSLAHDLDEALRCICGFQARDETLFQIRFVCAYKSSFPVVVHSFGNREKVSVEVTPCSVRCWLKIMTADQDRDIWSQPPQRKFIVVC